jgi:hypothetical protein
METVLDMVAQRKEHSEVLLRHAYNRHGSASTDTVGIEFISRLDDYELFW